MRQVMLANDDFDVDAEIAGAAENFDDASGGRSAAARKAQDLDVDDGAVEFVEMRDAGVRDVSRGDRSRHVRPFDRGGRARPSFSASCGVSSSPGEDFDGVLHAGVVRKDVVAARAVVEEADDVG